MKLCFAEELKILQKNDNRPLPSTLNTDPIAAFQTQAAKTLQQPWIFYPPWTKLEEPALPTSECARGPQKVASAVRKTPVE
jgi:hypothetical protein